MRVVTMVRILLSVVLLAMALPAQAQSAFKPVAVVNDSAVTGYDLAQRERILGSMGFNAGNEEAISRQALQSLIEERLKVQEAERLGIELSDEMMTSGVAEFAQRFNLTPVAFRERLQAEGVSAQAINDLIGAEALWREVVRARFLRRSEPSEAAIDAELRFLGAEDTRFRVRALRLNFDPDTSGAAVSNRIGQIYGELEAGLPFEDAVARYDEAEDAQVGAGGWISGANLPADLRRDLAQLSPGRYTRPVQVTGGVSILQLLEREAGNATPSPEDRERVRQRLVTDTLNRLAEGHLQELRRAALIEIR